MQCGTRISYKQLRKINPEAARLAVREYLRTNGHNIAHTARAFGITRPVIYDIIRKEHEGNYEIAPAFPITNPARHTTFQAN